MVSILDLDCAARFGWFTGEAGCLFRENASKVSQNVPNSAAECAITSGCCSGNLRSQEGTKLNIVIFTICACLLLTPKMKPFHFYF